MASVMTSMMYAVAVVAILAIILECCCRRQLKRMRELPHVIPLVVDNSTGRPVIQPYRIDGHSSTPYVPTATYAMPVPLTRSSYIPPTPVHIPPPEPNVQEIIEVPPPSYEQVMANARNAATQQRGS